MIVTIVTFELAAPASLAEITKTFQATAPKYRDVPGLLRKNYWLSEDGRRAGGIYVWPRAQTPSVSIPTNGKPSSRKNTASRRRSSTCIRR
ncbi:MAG TPA: hypothetical protein VFY53_14385 [Rhodoplanes sp.]|nr:hypothetical protein [Rhodoplanes sp.]